MTELPGIPYKLEHIDAKGRRWHPYEVEFTSPDGTYSVHLYAVSPEHAQLQLDALKESGRIGGKVEGVYPA